MRNNYFVYRTFSLEGKGGMVLVRQNPKRSRKHADNAYNNDYC